MLIAVQKAQQHWLKENPESDGSLAGGGGVLAVQGLSSNPPGGSNNGAVVIHSNSTVSLQVPDLPCFEKRNRVCDYYAMGFCSDGLKCNLFHNPATYLTSKNRTKEILEAGKKVLGLGVHGKFGRAGVTTGEEDKNEEKGR